MPDTRPMAGAETGAKPHNPPTSCEISRHHADNMRKPPVRGDGDGFRSLFAIDTLPQDRFLPYRHRP